MSTFDRPDLFIPPPPAAGAAAPSPQRGGGGPAQPVEGARQHPLPDYAAARAAARRARYGDPVYPRLFVLGGEWVRQDRPGGPLTVLTQPEADAAMLIRPLHEEEA